MFLRGGYSAIGLSPDLGVSGYLTRRAGAARAKYILMSNRAVAAEDCLRMGLVDELHEPEQLLRRQPRWPKSLPAVRQLPGGHQKPL
jgi:2-(1,2-epoxy-1,2-dihydrophenyl)acetyl-CoA isomerase